MMNVDCQEILDTLGYIAAQRRSVNLLTNFRGVPIEITAHLMRIARLPVQVHLFAHHRQIVALQTAALVLVQSELFHRPVAARVARLDPLRQTLSLGELAYTSGSMGQRRHPRAQPEHPLSAELNIDDGFRLNGRVIDVSLDGLSICITPDPLPVDQIFSPGTPLQVDLGLPGQTGQIVDLQIPAQVAYATPCSEPHCTRIGLLTRPEDAAQHLLRRYIFDRQTAILAEIQALNQELLQPIPA